jgi:predicted RNA binding protein YcfA (HicA-like mRNA interferase family)/predicted RNase H-like HicB family nuclease
MKVRDMIRRIEVDGWALRAIRGSHRQYTHPTQPGRVTVPGHPGDDLSSGMIRSILKQASLTRKGFEMRRYAVVIEKTGTGFGAYVPDLPGCVSTGRTVEETERNIREAIEFHLDGMREDGSPIPEPTTVTAYVELPAA